MTFLWLFLACWFIPAIGLGIYDTLKKDVHEGTPKERKVNNTVNGDIVPQMAKNGNTTQ